MHLHNTLNPPDLVSAMTNLATYNCMSASLLLQQNCSKSFHLALSSLHSI